MKAIRNTVIATAAIGMLASVSLQASAQSSTRVVAPSQTVSAKKLVSYADLDLQSPQGQEVLYYRISNAAEQLCGAKDPRRAGGLARAVRNAQCYEQSISRALAKVSAGGLASLN